MKLPLIITNYQFVPFFGRKYAHMIGKRVCSHYKSLLPFNGLVFIPSNFFNLPPKRLKIPFLSLAHDQDLNCDGNAKK